MFFSLGSRVPIPLHFLVLVHYSKWFPILPTGSMVELWILEYELVKRDKSKFAIKGVQDVASNV